MHTPSHEMWGGAAGGGGQVALLGRVRMGLQVVLGGRVGGSRGSSPVPHPPPALRAGCSVCALPAPQRGLGLKALHPGLTLRPSQHSPPVLSGRGPSTVLTASRLCRPGPPARPHGWVEMAREPQGVLPATTG